MFELLDDPVAAGPPLEECCPGPELSPVDEVARVCPSGWLALELEYAAADVAVLSDAEVLDVAVAFGRVAAWARAQQLRLLAEFGRRRPGDDPRASVDDRPGSIWRWAPDEVALAFGVSRLWAKTLLGEAEQLAGPLVGVRAAFERGEVDEAKAGAFCAAAWGLTDEQAGAVVGAGAAAGGGPDVGAGAGDAAAGAVGGGSAGRGGAASAGAGGSAGDGARRRGRHGVLVGVAAGAGRVCELRVVDAVGPRVGCG